MKRLYNLDYLRGLAALGIFFYHYFSWTFGKPHANMILGRIGVYGVSIFYILSGLTLYLVYHSKITNSKIDVLDFLKKRIFRIYPLLWLAIISSTLISAKWPGLFNLFSNLSGLFGFINWDGYLATGAWSIGNELVIYVFFPLFIYSMCKSRHLFIILSVLIFLIYIFFAFNVFNPNIHLTDQWTNYVNPLNQIFLFLGGILIGYVFEKIEINKYLVIAILLIGICLYVFYPSENDAISIVFGWSRLVFTLSCFMICYSFYKMNIIVPSIINKPLMFFGEISYSLYLLHPIVYTLIGIILTYSSSYFKLPTFSHLVISIILSIVVSYFSYNYFEKYFIKMAKSKNEIK